MSCLRDNRILKTVNKNTADIFRRQFGSAYTREKAGDIPSKGLSPYPDIEDISIDLNGVRKRLDCLNPHKALGPDDLSARVLNNCRDESAQGLACVLNQSLTKQ